MVMEDRAKLMVVEDEFLVAQDLANRLERMGHEVVAVVPSGEEALDRAARDHPDLVLMDILLQGELDGIQAAGELKKRWGIPSVYLTAYAEDRVVQRAVGSAPLGYLIKPYRNDELKAAVTLALSQALASDEAKNKNKVFATLMPEVLPTCAECRRVRTEDGEWIELELYLRRKGIARPSHSLCKTCVDKLYPNMAARLNSEDQ